MSEALTVKFKFPKLENRIKKNHKRIEQFVAAAMQTNRALLFEHSGEYSGHQKWAPLKFRNGKPLLLRGTLRKSIAPQNDGLTPKQGDNGIIEYRSGIVKIGTRLAYAAIQNNGGVIKAKNAKALKIPLPQGKMATKEGKAAAEKNGKFMFRKSVTIPARNFDSITPQDRDEFETALKAVLAEVLKDGED
jgi:phage gpG-like protein